MTYRPEIDGLRALAVIPVILFHAGLGTFSGGFVGVDVFFVISGYLITSIIITEQQAGTFSLVRFYERRARRILPALFFVMLFCIPFAWYLMLPSEIENFSQSVFAVTVFSSNILFWRESGYFDSPAELKPLLHTWSLAVEEQYYLFFPLLIILAWRFCKRWILFILLFTAGISLAAAQWGSLNAPAATFYLLPTRAWELLIGSFIAIYLLSTNNTVIRIDKFAEPLSVLGLLLIVYAIFAFNEHTPFPSAYGLIPTIGTALVVLFANQDTIVGTLLSSKLLVGVGLISYSAYLWHQPLLAFYRSATSKAPSGLMVCLIFFAMAILAYLTWYFIEQPFRSKDQVSSKAFFNMISLFCIAFISAGIYGSVTNGYVINKTAQVSDRLQLLAKLAAERHTLIRLGVCHYNGSVGTMGVQQFLGQWDCKTDATQPPLKRIPLIIAGDSHSADKVMALRLNGYAPLQMDAAGCSLRPKYMTKDCFAIFEKLYALTKDDAYYKYIAIARSFEVDELTLDAIKDTIEYWQKFNKKIILFTNMPVYTDMNRKFAHDRPVLPDTSIAELSERKEIMEYLVAHGVYVVNTREIFCRITKTCSYISNDGHLLLVDKHHLSRRGARLFGEILMEDNLFRSIVELD